MDISIITKIILENNFEKWKIHPLLLTVKTEIAMDISRITKVIFIKYGNLTPLAVKNEFSKTFKSLQFLWYKVLSTQISHS